MTARISTTAAIPLILCAACFSPNVSEDGSTSEVSSGGTGEATQTTAPVATETTPEDTTTGLAGETEAETSGPESEGSSGGATSEGETCDAASRCGGLLCIDDVCASCTMHPSPDEGCLEADPDQPVCDGDSGRCVACLPASCEGATPVCDEEAGCRGCEWHDECESGACHLGGPDAGRCFEAADVIEVQSPGAFADLLAEVGPGTARAFLLDAATYTLPTDSFSYAVEGGRELAFLGNGSTVLEGGISVGGFNGGTSGITYVSGCEFGTASSPATLQVDDDSELWVDDSTSPGAVLSSGIAHFRNSNLTEGLQSPFGPGFNAGGAVFMENVSVGPAPFPSFSLSGAVDIRYSTIVVEGSIGCDASTGVIRNSIVLSAGSPAVEGNCESMTWEQNAVNEPGFGQQVGDYDPEWFSPHTTTSFLISASGLPVFEDIAEWADGDPKVDIQGNERPQDAPGFPGVHQP